ncbi:MAG: XRE family transcriptional regulator [Methanomassiliicoccaceae archaeon]|nr:XRE family transcriptional regulator [Methanomassiliicoccaceae archaeon]
MEPNIAEVAERIRELRETEGYSQEEIARAMGVSLEQYIEIEAGRKDLSLSTLYKCAKKLGVDSLELLSGDTPKLSGYVIDRIGEAIPTEEHMGFLYRHLASNFRNKTVVPLLVTAPYVGDQKEEMPMSTHEGQEFDHILEGRLELRYGKHTEILMPGDSVFYDSSKEHRLTAPDKGGCKFIAIVIKKESV